MQTHLNSSSAVRLTAILLLGLVLAPVAHSEDRETSYSVLMNQDNFFGFYPSFNGLVEVNDNMDFSFYGILWTRDAFGTTGTGDDLWTEFGAGVNLKYMDGNLNVKPQIGITNGSLLSGGETDSNGTGGYFLDGVVPSLTVNYADDRFEAEWYSGWYLAARDGDSEAGTNDFLHLWANGGFRFNDYVSAGLHYEWLDQTDGGNEDHRVHVAWTVHSVQPTAGFLCALQRRLRHQRRWYRRFLQAERRNELLRQRSPLAHSPCVALLSVHALPGATFGLGSFLNP